ncbi:MAG TPA: Ig-like domain-containing protein, partial [Gemmatimonadaceae bacterium]|nr:Ig-like domain-containing protein [Gemmatimonadaceae bacterium]
AKDAAGNILSRAITWVSLAPNIASVNATGLVTANAGGSATIQARANGAGVGGVDVVGTAAITVNVPVHSISVTSPRSFVVASDTMHLTVVLRDALNNVITGRPVTFASSAPASATVNTSGIVSGGGAAGNADITATSQGNSATVQLRSIAGVTAMAVTGPANNVALDTLLSRTQTKTYTVTVTAGGAPVSGVTIAISNNNPSAMSTSASNVTTNGLGQGSVNVTASSFTGSASITFVATRAGAIPPGMPGSNTPAVSIRIVVP